MGMMNSGSKQRQMDRLVRLRREAGQGTDDIFGFAEMLIDELAIAVDQRDNLRAETEPARATMRAKNEELTSELTTSGFKVVRLKGELQEMRDQAEPVLVRQAHDMGILRDQVKSRNTDLASLRRQVRDLEGELTLLQGISGPNNQQQRIANYEREIDRLDSQVAVLENQADTTRVLAVESLMANDYAYRTKGKNGIDTIDRMRGPIWSDRNRGENGNVHRVGENIRIGEEVRLAKSSLNRTWVWVKVQP